MLGQLLVLLHRYYSKEMRGTQTRVYKYGIIFAMDCNNIAENTCAMSLDDVERELRGGNRVLLLVRHAERPHIDNEDPSFGAALGLTDEGTLAPMASRLVGSPGATSAA